jgi:hypothetical protein
MTDADPGSGLAELEAAKTLAAIAEAVEDELGSKPTLAELVEILGWAVPTREESLDAPSAVIRFRARLRDRRRVEVAPESRVNELGDAVFAEAAEGMAALARALARQAGRTITLPELAAALGDGLRTGSGIAVDLAPGDVVALEVMSSKPLKRTRAGDMIAIPEGDGGYRLAVVLAHNSFGTALGLFSDSVALPRLSSLGSRTIVPYAVHTDEQQLISGIWKVVGHNETLIPSFPEPEIYHAPDERSPHPELHGYGAAETADGRLRPISKEEAIRVGLVDGNYDAGFLSEYLEFRLPAIR